MDISYDQPGDKILRWASYLHYGNFGGPWWKAVWVFLSKKWNRLRSAQSPPRI